MIGTNKLRTALGRRKMVSTLFWANAVCGYLLRNAKIQNSNFNLRGWGAKFGSLDVIHEHVYCETTNLVVLVNVASRHGGGRGHYCC